MSDQPKEVLSGAEQALAAIEARIHRSPTSLLRHALEAQLHTITTATEAALTILALLDQRDASAPASAPDEEPHPGRGRIRRRPRTEQEAQFFGKLPTANGEDKQHG